MFSRSQVFDTPGVHVFNRPSPTTEFVWADVYPGGAAGAGNQSFGGGGNTGGGGACGEWYEQIKVFFTSDTLSITVGSGGTGATGTPSSICNGGDSIVGDKTALGPTWPGPDAYRGCRGGGPAGGAPAAGIPSQPVRGGRESPRGTGGTSGGGGGNRGDGSETNPLPVPGSFRPDGVSGSSGGGGAGGGSQLGPGADGRADSGTATAGIAATNFGAGGGGANTDSSGTNWQPGGTGAGGKVILYWWDFA